MNKLALGALVLVLTACGRSAAPAPTPSPAPAPLAAETTAATPAIAVAAWSNVEDIEDLMKDNGRSMRQIKNAIQRNDLAGAHVEATGLITGLKDLQARSRGFEGATPDRFRTFADDAVTAAMDLDARITSGTDTAGAIAQAMTNVRGTCKSCHDLYKKDED